MTQQPATPLDPHKFINPAQIGGIERYVLGDGQGRGVWALCVNTGGGLRYRVLADRGLDIDHAFYHQHSLTFLTHKGVTAPSRGLDHGLDWLKGFPGGLLTSCGPFNIGGPVVDAGEELGLHGPHSNTAAEIESVTQPDPHRGRAEMSITGVVRYGAFYGPCVTLRRTIRSVLGENAIDVTDEFHNAGNTDVPHAWLLHINFGYPLIDAGAELCYAAEKVEPRDDDPSRAHFREGSDYKRVPDALDAHRGPGSVVAYLYPAPGADGRATVGVVNGRLGLGVAIRYDTQAFPRCGNWQHFGPGEYVTALEPMNGTVDGRDQDRAHGLLDTLAAGATKTYQYRIEVITGPNGVEALRQLNA